MISQEPSTQKPRRAHVGRCPVDDYDLDSLVGYLSDSIREDRKTLVSGVNATMYVRTADDPEYLANLEAMDVVTSDGHWVAKAARLLGAGKLHHLAIVRLTLGLLETLRTEGADVFLLGTKPDFVKAAAVNIEKRFPGIRVVGTRDGYFTDDDEGDIARAIDESGASIVLVGISTPKRESWMIRHRDSFRAPVVIGVGGLLDIFAGETQEGPDWLRSIGMMWFYRFLQEPRRMWKRYLVDNTRFLWLLFKHAVSSKTSAQSS